MSILNNEFFKGDKKKPEIKIMYVITCKIFYRPEKGKGKYMKQYYTGQEQYGQTVLTGWNIYKKYAYIFTDLNEANIVCGKLKKLIGSEKSKVKMFNQFSKN